MKLVVALLLTSLVSAVPRKDASPGGDDSRIIAGNVARPGQFPYQAAIMINSKSFCGGSIISNFYVLTAAHCVDGGQYWTIYVGAHNMMHPAEPSRQVLVTRAGHHHEQYNRTTLQHDVALIKTYSPIVFNDRVSALRLPSQSQLGDLFANTPATVSGWGKTTNDGVAISAVLKYADVTIISNEECKARYDSEPILSTTLCAQGTATTSTCNGDSGGPLVVKDADGAPMQVGVVSFVSDSGCDKGMPQGYSRLTDYMSWLSSKTGIPIRQG